jgi:hypothetical protein
LAAEKSAAEIRAFWTETAKRPPLAALAPQSSSFLAGWGWPLLCAAIVAIAWWLG